MYIMCFSSRRTHGVCALPNKAITELIIHGLATHYRFPFDNVNTPLCHNSCTFAPIDPRALTHSAAAAAAGVAFIIFATLRYLSLSLFLFRFPLTPLLTHSATVCCAALISLVAFKRLFAFDQVGTSKSN